MIRVELHIGTTIYRFASETLDYQGYIWEARVNNPVELQRLFSFTDKTGNRKRTISLTLDNQDDFFNDIHATYSLLNKRIVVYFDDGSNLTKKMVGHTTEILNFNRTLNLNLSEYDNLYFEQPVPDLQIAYDYYSEGGFNENWNAIPIIFGFVKRLKVAWVDKVNFRFMISSGENYKIEKVYFDKQVIYDADTSVNGYKATPESQNIKVRVYHGSQNEVVDTIASAYPNLSYIEFYDEATGLAIEPLMTDGKVPEIYVDVQGIINDSRSGCERNPARLLYKLMSYPITGYNGWGMGVPVTDLSFNEAIGWCEINKIYIDGVIDKRLNASDWIDELCRHFAGALVEDSGVLTLVIDKPVNITTCEFDESGELGYHCNLDGWNEPALESQINRLRLFYKYNYEFSNFDKKPDFNEESPCLSTELKNVDHYTKIGQWNTATLEFPFFSDDTAAHKIAIQYFKRDILQLKTIQLITSVDIPTILDVKHKIKVTSARFGWSQKEFLIKEIVKGEKNTRIVAREYDATVYESTLDLTPVEYIKVEYGKYDIPLKPTNFIVTQTNTPRNDGTLQTILALSATKLATNIKNLLFYRKKEGESSWQYFGSTETESLNYIWDREDGDYYIRVVSQTPYGVCSDIEIASGDTHYYGQPGAESKITIFTNYTTVAAPLTAPTLGIYMKTVRVEINQTPGTSKDLVAFQIWRSETADSGTATKVGEIACQGWGTKVVHLDDSTGYGKTYYYWVKAVNSTGNASNFSPISAAITTEQVKNVDLGPLSVDLAQICTNAIRECHIYAGAVTALKIGACEISSYHVGTNELIANSANIKDLVVTSAKISSLVADKIDTGVIAVGRNIGSSNYVAGSSGWNIHGNGSAEFSNVTVRGIVCATAGCFNGAVTATSGTFTGTICSAAGKIGGFDIGATSIATTSQICLVNIYSNASGLPSVIFGYCDGSGYTNGSFGQILCHGAAWSCKLGMNFYSAGNTYFEVSRNVSTGALIAQLSGWCFNSQDMWNSLGCNTLALNTSARSIYTHRTSDSNYGEWHGQIYNNGGWTGRYGFAITRGVGNYLFRVDTAADGSAACAKIAGWNMEDTGLVGYLDWDAIYLQVPYACPSVRVLSYDRSTYSRAWATQGRTYWNGTYQNTFGFSVEYNNSLKYLSGVSTLGTTALPNGDSATIAQPVFWVGETSNYLRWLPGSLKVFGCACQTASFVELHNTCTSTSENVVLCITSNSYSPVGVYTIQVNAIIGSAACSRGVIGASKSYGILGFARDDVTILPSIPGAGCFGVYGEARYCYGVYGHANTYGVYACATSDYAGAFVSNGNVSVYGNAAFYSLLCMCAPVYCLTSSKSIKHAYTPITGIMDNLRKLPVEAFKRYSDPSGRFEVGTYAEDFQCLFPWLGDGKGLSLNTMIGLNLKALQEVDIDLRSLKERVDKIEGKNNDSKNDN